MLVQRSIAPTLASSKSTHPYSVQGVEGDIANPADRARLYETLRADKLRIDVLFANAGVGDFGPIRTITETQFDHIVGVNLKGTLLCF
ncbi:SDR family NAD(P)-dependent oxidoreductase [Glaciimonas sp. PCH181]|uniref:SDR family NAD(P)-dependent oxidoreductase n=1 Tax=Glaciimonas sp. PCH181 TaxID=2133943 RepID=UPI000D3894DA|nr:SDR family NAD(P)-dependent oxidoreductase [Glaciimonas sp. PCH181]PUA19111.1 hypothetical protein C7W93_04230 [Glaciimonas sp. PCH181]